MTERDYIVNNLKEIISDVSTNTTTQDKLRALDMLITLEKRHEDALAHALGRKSNPYIIPYKQIYY